MDDNILDHIARQNEYWERITERLSERIRSLEQELRYAKDDLYALQRRVDSTEQTIDRLNRGW